MQNKSLMTLNNMKIKIREILKITEDYMHVCQIKIRDTWKGYDSPCNYDDLNKNGKFHGPKSIRIKLVDDGNAEFHANESYSLEGFTSCAYDDCEIRVHRRDVKFKHSAIHEAVHFLQENTLTEVNCSVIFNGKNRNEYLTQRTELEAQFVQLRYLFENEIDLLQINTFKKVEFKKFMKDNLVYNENSKNLIIYSRMNGII